MLTPGTFALTLLLSFLTALGPLSMDMYLPSLPDIARALHAPILDVQLTISSYLFGFAVGQIFYGPISDRLGRKPILLGALVLYGVASIGCALAQSVDGLIAMRFLQALGGAGVIVLARAVVRDIYSGPRASRELSLMGADHGVCADRRTDHRRSAADRLRLARDLRVVTDFRLHFRRSRRLAVAGNAAQTH